MDEHTLSHSFVLSVVCFEGGVRGRIGIGLKYSMLLKWSKLPHKLDNLFSIVKILIWQIEESGEVVNWFSFLRHSYTVVVTVHEHTDSVLAKISPLTGQKEMGNYRELRHSH